MKENIKAIITGDIVNSRLESPSKWQKQLIEDLKKYGKTPETWEIFRGDMFQLEVPAKEALKIALLLKASIKRNKNMDVRMAIGIGTLDFKQKSISESNGQAYTLSGECFERLNKRRLAVNSPWPLFNREWNLHLGLASLTMNQWTAVSSEIIYEVLSDESLNQNTIAKKINKTQSTISEGLSRAGFVVIKAMCQEYEIRINKEIQQVQDFLNRKKEEEE